MNIEKRIENDFVVLSVSGRLDSHTSPDLSDFLSGFEDSLAGGMIIDMKQLDYISSAGLRVILNYTKLCKSNETQFCLCNMQDHVREVFEISGFDLFIDIYSSLEDALHPDKA